jgi:hypothetical protein
MREVFAGQKQEVQAFEGEWSKLSQESLKPLNDQARQLDFPVILAP